MVQDVELAECSSKPLKLDLRHSPILPMSEARHEELHNQALRNEAACDKDDYLNY